MEKNISNSSKIRISIVEDHLIELYQSGVQEERDRILSVIKNIIKEKQVRSDYDAIAILDWTLDRILRS
jgi:hypothetical protein